MSKCNWNFGNCDAVAATTLMKNSGEIVQLCEEHHDFMVKLLKSVAAGERYSEREDAEDLANHWLVKNKIPS